ncbi:lytic murein transglycosylase [Mesorhizobium calcicola]|uniref:Lytic murein transglycosylase n=1 Tax=Mesorhizobium calcicola TaxID=1300310 RepID=A0ABW4WQL3_9HYPH
MDGNGKRDIWNSIPDALATAANLLKKNGWQAGKTWGAMKGHLACRQASGGSRHCSQWQGALGVVRANGKPFKNGGDKATLESADGPRRASLPDDQEFLGHKAYNNADKYALAVGLLADEIAGSSGLVQDWKRPLSPSSLSRKAGRSCRNGFPRNGLSMTASSMARSGGRRLEVSHPWPSRPGPA